VSPQEKLEQMVRLLERVDFPDEHVARVAASGLRVKCREQHLALGRFRTFFPGRFDSLLKKTRRLWREEDHKVPEEKEKMKIAGEAKVQAKEKVTDFKEFAGPDQPHGVVPGMASKYETRPVDDLVVTKRFSNLMPKDPRVLEQVTRDMAENGYNWAFPLILFTGEWIEGGGEILGDGHTRREAALANGIKEVPVVVHKTSTELDALYIVLGAQFLKRPQTDGLRLHVLRQIDHYKKRGGKKRQSGAKGKSVVDLVAIMGMSARSIERLRAVSKHAELSEKVLKGEMSFHAAYVKLPKDEKPARSAKTGRDSSQGHNDAEQKPKECFGGYQEASTGCKECPQIAACQVKSSDTHEDGHEAKSKPPGDIGASTEEKTVDCENFGNHPSMRPGLIGGKCPGCPHEDKCKAETQLRRSEGGAENTGETLKEPAEGNREGNPEQGPSVKTGPTDGPVTQPTAHENPESGANPTDTAGSKTPKASPAAGDDTPRTRDWISAAPNWLLNGLQEHVDDLSKAVSVRITCRNGKDRYEVRIVPTKRANVQNQDTAETGAGEGPGTGPQTVN
jgi:hypothetical protein